MSLTLSTAPFGVTASGTQADLYTLCNANGMEVVISNYGGVIQSLLVPDLHGNRDDVVLGYDTLAEYEKCDVYLGCLVGRYANRIASSRFTLDGIEYPLEKNLGKHHLHSASAGFNKVVWDATTSLDDSKVTLTLQYLSADGHGGYPGALRIEVRYTLNADNELCIDYFASVDKPTVVNLTNHSYFNLRGHQYAQVDGVLDHELELSASRFIPTDHEGIPEGGVSDVVNTPLDFRQSTPVGDRIDVDHQQLVVGSGYDHTWLIDGVANELRPAARIRDNTSGRSLSVHTTQPGMQFYTANHLGMVAGKGGHSYQRRGALCCETQHLANSPNVPTFPSTVLRPGQKWCQSTVFQFTVE